MKNLSFILISLLSAQSTCQKIDNFYFLELLFLALFILIPKIIPNKQISPPNQIISSFPSPNKHLNNIPTTVHINKRHKNPRTIIQHLVCMAGFQRSVDIIVDSTCWSVCFDFYNISLLKSSTLLCFLWVSVTAVIAVVAHCIAGAVGRFWVFLFGVIDNSEHNVPGLGSDNFEFVLCWFVVVNGKIENIMSPNSPNKLYLQSLDFEIAAGSLLQIGVGDRKPNCIKFFLQLCELVQASLILYL